MKRTTEIDIKIGKNLKFFRTKRGMCQQHLSDKIGVTFQQIQKYEKGINRITGGMLYKLSKALDVPISAFFDEEEDTNYIDNDYSREFLTIGKMLCEFKDEKDRKIFLEALKKLSTLINKKE